MEKEKILFTSESVTEGHPDKMCDAISDAILDAIMKEDPMGRVACETATTTGLVLVMGEITTSAYVDIQKIVRDTVREIVLMQKHVQLSQQSMSSPQTSQWELIKLWKQKWVKTRSMQSVPETRV